MTSANGETCEISGENYAYLQQQIYRSSGIVLDESKRYLLETRLTPIIRRENLKSINDLCALLRATSKPKITQEIMEAMTTNETFFFRDVVPFKILKEKILPALLEERKSSRQLSIWSAAASSGQEAYSLIMMLLEMGLKDWKLDILGTDIAEKVLERARGGKYIQIEVNRGLPAPYLVKYFTRQGLEWQVKDELRRMARFQQFDLRQPMKGFGPFDIILCRNVLIYFDVETKKNILRQMEGTLRRGGSLLLGAAETTMNLNVSLERQVVDGGAFYVKR